MKSIISIVVTAVCVPTGGHSTEFKSEFISIKKQGSGPDIVLLHGFASSSDVWAGTVKQLDSRFTLHAVQVAGFAGSKAPRKLPESFLNRIRDEVIRYIEVQKLRKPILIGHSMGGFTSLRVAAKNPRLVGKVIVVDSLPFFSLLFNPLATSETVLPYAKAWEKKVLAQKEAEFRKQAKKGISILTKQESKKAVLLTWSTTSDRRIYAQAFRELLAHDARAELRNISCPVVVIYPFDEAMKVPQEQLGQVYKNAYSKLKGARFRVVAGSFHFIMWDQPKQFFKLLNQELAEDKKSRIEQ